MRVTCRLSLFDEIDAFQRGTKADMAGEMNGKSVLVTGAGGFIGSHLAEALVRAGAHVRALVHYNSRGSWGQLDRIDRDVQSEVEVIMGDVRDGERMRQAIDSRQIVFHLA